MPYCLLRCAFARKSSPSQRCREALFRAGSRRTLPPSSFSAQLATTVTLSRRSGGSIRSWRSRRVGSRSSRCRWHPSRRTSPHERTQTSSRGRSSRPLEGAARELQEMRQECERLRSSVAEEASAKEAIGAALLKATRVGEEITAEARAAAEWTTAEAEARAATILEQAAAKADQLE